MNNTESTSNKLSDAHIRLIENLREEANSVKECFTKISFQTIALSSVVLGLIIRFQGEFPHIAIATVFITTLLLSVARIGTFKYGTANRHFGYELHLHRSLFFSDIDSNGWKSYMRDIGWEEAMRSWRVIQPTLFVKLYYPSKLKPNWLRPEYKNKKDLWFEPKTLLEEKSQYYSGSYLKSMLFFLHFLAIISLFPLIISIYQIFCGDNFFFFPCANGDQLIILIIISFLALLVIVYRIVKDTARRKILESGLLSIHSCAIIWQAVVLAHYKALYKLKAKNDVGLHNYTKYLSQEALDLAKEDNILFIYSWVIGQNNK
jgi:hypothetical protein